MIRELDVSGAKNSVGRSSLCQFVGFDDFCADETPARQGNPQRGDEAEFKSN